VTIRRQLIAAAQGGGIHPTHLIMALHLVSSPYCAVKTPKLMQAMGLARGYDTSEDAGVPYQAKPLNQE
tara:strand:- start:20526 stop:20732 length:207 start_codon:yes stop_codon:yes gene_type:complete